MVVRLKSWESPRRRGRNDKGKGGSARQRQLKKQQQMLRKKLKGENQQKSNQPLKEREINLFPFFLGNFGVAEFLPGVNYLLCNLDSHVRGNDRIRLKRKIYSKNFCNLKIIFRFRIKNKKIYFSNKI